MLRKKYNLYILLITSLLFIGLGSCTVSRNTSVNLTPEKPLSGKYPTVENWNDIGYAQANTAQDVNYLSADEKEFIRLTNLVRMNPSFFEHSYLNEHLNRFPDDENYVKSLREELKKQKPLPLLYPNVQLCKAAAYHAADMGKTGKVGHVGSDKQNPAKRMAKFGMGNCFLAENCTYGSETPLEMLCSLLIDSGVPSLGHRKNLLCNDYDKVGVSIRPHKSKFKINMVQDFAGRCSK